MRLSLSDLDLPIDSISYTLDEFALVQQGSQRVSGFASPPSIGSV